MLVLGVFARAAAHLVGWVFFPITDQLGVRCLEQVNVQLVTKLETVKENIGKLLGRPGTSLNISLAALL